MYKKLETAFGSTECNFEMDGNKWDIETIKNGICLSVSSKYAYMCLF